MKDKGSRARSQVIFGTVLFVLALIAELYVMTHASADALAAVLAVITLGCAYIAVNGMLSMQKERDQYLFKSEKAAYLLSKRNFEELGSKLNGLEDAAEASAKEIIHAQKGIAKATVRYSREKTDDILEQLSAIAGRLDMLTRAVEENRNAIAENRSAIGENRNAIAENSDIVSTGESTVKDIEAQLSGILKQIQSAVAQGAFSAAAAQDSSALRQQGAGVSEEAAASGLTEAENLQGAGVSGAAVTPGLVEAGNPQEAGIPGADMAEAGNPQEAGIPGTETADVAGLAEAGNPQKAANEEAGIVEGAAMPDMDEFPKEELLDAALADAGEALTDLIKEMPEAEAEPGVLPQEEKPPMPDLSDPNKALSMDEIDALFANMGVDMPASKEPQVSEPEFQPDVIMDAELLEPAKEPEPKSVPKPEKNEAGPALDPNKPLSPAEIDALFASMGVGDTSSAEPIPEPEPEPAPAPEAKPPMPDMSDPNKAMSPEEIAALFANLS